jgi:hypothetical protein
MSQDEITIPDSLQAILVECRKAANAALETRADVHQLVERFDKLESRVSRLESFQLLMPLVAMVLSVAALVTAAFK